MTAKELYLMWCKRMKGTVDSYLVMKETGAVSEAEATAYCRAVQDSMNTAEIILTEGN